MSDGMSDARDYGPSLSKHGPPLVVGRGLLLSIADAAAVKNLVELSRLLGQEYARKTGCPLNDLRVMDAANAVERILRNSGSSEC